METTAKCGVSREPEGVIEIIDSSDVRPRPRAICEQLIDMLGVHTVYERRDRPEIVDRALLGLLHSLRLLHSHLTVERRRALLRDTFADLFSVPSVAEARALGPTAPPKCKSIDTRVCALALLAEMAESGIDGDAEREELVELLIELQDQRGGAAAPRALWHYMPSAMERARCGYVGLKNLGATCYLNALAQQLYMIPEFRVGIIELPLQQQQHDAEEREQHPLQPQPPSSCSPQGDEQAPAASQPNRALLSQLQVMFSFLHESEKRFYDTRDLCNAWRDYDARPINPSIQMDVDEFYNMLFEQLEGALRDTPGRKLLQSLLGPCPRWNPMSHHAPSPDATRP